MNAPKCNELAIVLQTSPAALSHANGAAVVVHKVEIVTLRQSHNFVLIDFKFGVGDYVREVTSPDKVGPGPMSGRDAM